MNTLNLIKKQLLKEKRIQSYNRSIAYRGVKYEMCKSTDETHGTFCYRGRTYVK